MDDAKKPLILVIDDENGIRMYLKMMFEKKNFAVAEGDNGIEGFEQVVKELPALVVMDIAMIGLSGIEIYRKIRAREDTKDIPVLFCSALSLPPDIEISPKNKVAYLNKPFEFDEVYAKVVDLLSIK